MKKTLLLVIALFTFQLNAISFNSVLAKAYSIKEALTQRAADRMYGIKTYALTFWNIQGKKGIECRATFIDYLVNSDNQRHPLVRILNNSKFNEIKHDPKSSYHYILTGKFAPQDGISDEQFVAEYAEVEQVINPEQTDLNKLKNDAALVLIQSSHIHALNPEQI